MICKYILLFVFASSNGEEWYKFRSTVNPIMMHPKVMKPYAERIDPVANEFLDMMRHFAKNNPSGEMPENFSKEIHKFTLEVAVLIGMDRRIGSIIMSPKACAQCMPQSMSVNAFGVGQYIGRLRKYYKFLGCNK